jgi:hypothetical protein
MTRREQYNLIFRRIIDDGYTEFLCYQLDNDLPYARLAEKLRLMHKVECLGLIETIEDAENNQYYEEYFSLDRDAASDTDEIRILPPNVIIDQDIIIPFQDMKELLQEWVTFMETKTYFQRLQLTLSGWWNLKGSSTRN